MQGDAVAHRLELSDGSFLGSVGVEAGEELRAGVFLERAGGAHVPDRDEHGVLDCDIGLLRSAPRGDAPVSGIEVGVGVLRAGHRRGTKCSLQVRVAGSGAAGLHLSGRLVVPQRGPRPGREVLDGGEPGHVRTGLGDDRVRGRVPDPGDGADQVTELLKGSIITSIRAVSASSASVCRSIRSETPSTRQHFLTGMPASTSRSITW